MQLQAYKFITIILKKTVIISPNEASVTFECHSFLSVTLYGNDGSQYNTFRSKSKVCMIN